MNYEILCALSVLVACGSTFWCWYGHRRESQANINRPEGKISNWQYAQANRIDKKWSKIFLCSVVPSFIIMLICMYQTL